MANRFAVATGNWADNNTWAATSGGAPGASFPVAGDNAYFDAASGNITVTIGADAACVDLGMMGSGGASSFTGTLIWGSATFVLRVTGNLTFPTSGTITGAGGTVQMNTGTTKTVTFNTSNTLNLFMNFGAQLDGGSWTISGAMKISQRLTLSSGTLNTGNQAITANDLFISGSTARTLTMGSSAITLTGGGTPLDASTVTNLTISANTAVLTLSGAGVTASGSGMNCQGASISYTGSGVASHNLGGTWANVSRIGTAVKTDSFLMASTTITGTLTLTGNSAVNRICVQGNGGFGVARTLTAAAVALTNVDFQDITGAGAATWTGTSIGNCLGNTNITFDAPTTQTHDGTTSNWSTAARWTSRVPLPQDTVLIPSGSGTITADMPRLGADINFTGFTGTVTTAAGTVTIYGSITAASGMTFTFSGTNNLSGRSTHTITSAGKSFGVVTINKGTYTLADALSTGNGALTVQNAGALNSGNFTISCGQLVILDTSSFTGGTSTVNLAITAVANVVLVQSGTTISAASTTLIVSTASASARTFAGGGKTYGDVRFPGGGAGAITITGANTFNRIYTDGGGTLALVLPGSTTTTIISGSGLANGANLVTITASAGSATISKASGVLQWRNVSLTNIPSTGGAKFYAAANSVDGGGNTGWIFGSAPSSGSGPGRSFSRFGNLSALT